MNELINVDTHISFTPCRVEFPMFLVLKDQIHAIADKIRAIEVTEESLKAVKKDLANINKGIKTLDGRCKSVKKEVIAPFTEVENQVKELISILSEADNEVRTKARELEEKERNNKFNVILDLFNKRNAIYKFSFVSVENFVKPQHLNKSVSLNRVETEMVEWFEKIKRDLDAISEFNDENYEEEVLSYYINCLDLTTAISQVAKHQKLKEQVKVIQDRSQSTSVDEPKLATVQFENQSDLIKVIEFMNSQGIKYNLK